MRHIENVEQSECLAFCMLGFHECLQVDSNTLIMNADSEGILQNGINFAELA